MSYRGYSKQKHLTNRLYLAHSIKVPKTYDAHVYAWLRAKSEWGF